MNKTRYLKLVIVPVLILAALIALQAFKPTAGAKNSNLPYIGIGDLRRYEAQLSITDTDALESSRPSTGMGDLHLFEMQQSIPGTGAQASSRPFAGMGDLHRLEAMQEP
jgi:hypothetical protein